MGRGLLLKKEIKEGQMTDYTGNCEKCQIPNPCGNIHWAPGQREKVLAELENEEPLFIRTENGIVRNDKVQSP